MKVETARPGPCAPEARIPTLDAIRGVALLGILIMNMPGFGTSFFAGADGRVLWPAPWDRAAEWVGEALFAGKFNSMFSLLFGLGFTLQYGRLLARDPASATPVYLRRLAVLLVFGLVHATVFWTGDILHVYAVLGLVLVGVLQRASVRTLVLLMGLCLLYPVVNGLLRLWLVTPEVVQAMLAKAKAFEASNNAAYGHGSFWQAAAEHAREFAAQWSDRWALWWQLSGYVMLALTMLLGVVAGRLRWAERIPELLPRLPRLQWSALALGLGCGVVYTVIFELNRVPGPSPIKWLGTVCFWVCRPALMVFYVLTVVRLMQRPRWASRLAPFVAAGRMPLTNYLMQTLVFTFVFYGWGLGLWGQVGPALQLVLALVFFFGVQAPLSLWWFGRHRRGPLEALWARLTYGSAAATARPARAV